MNSLNNAILRDSKLLQTYPKFKLPDPTVEYKTQISVYKSIYSKFQTLAVYCKIFGVIGVQNVFSSTPDGQLAFKWFSLDTLWVLLFNIGLQIGVQVYCLVHLKVGREVDYVYMYFTGATCLVTILNLTSSKQLIKLIRKIQLFDETYYFALYHIKRLESGSKVSTWVWVQIIFWVTILLAVNSGLRCMFALDVLPLAIMRTLSAYLMMNPMYSIFILHTFFCFEIKYRFSVLRSVTYAILSQAPSSSQAQDIESVRILHAKLASCSRTFSRAFGPSIFAILGAIVTSILIDLALSIRGTIKIPDELMWFSFEVTSLFFVIALSISTQGMIDQAHNVLLESYELPIAQCDADTKFQLVYFQQQLGLNVVNFNCFHVFEVDMPFLGSFSTLVITYIIALMQFTEQIRSM